MELGSDHFSRVSEGRWPGAKIDGYTPLRRQIAISRPSIRHEIGAFRKTVSHNLVQLREISSMRVSELQKLMDEGSDRPRQNGKIGPN